MALDRSELVRIAYLVGVAILVLPAFLAAHRSGRTWLRNAVLWLAIGAALVLLYYGLLA